MSRIRDFLYQGAEEAQRAGRDIIRIRYECIAFFLYYAALAVLLMIQLPGLGSLFLCAVSLTIILIFRLSYGKSAHVCPGYLTVITAAVSVICVFLFGTGYAFQSILFGVLMSSLLDPEIPYGIKTKYCLLGMFIPCLTKIIYMRTGAYYTVPPDGILRILLGLINETFLAAYIIIIGLTYAKHSVEVERQLILSNQRLRMASQTDALTGLPNRRAILEVLDEIGINAGKSITIGMGDIDHFKMVNDTYGHAAGDEVLKNVSAAIQDFMEPYGYCARWGGEEFLIVFAGYNGDESFSHMEKLRNIIKNLISDCDGTKLQVTMTFGIEEHGFFRTTEETIRKADEKLYLGKQAGRNRVVY